MPIARKISEIIQKRADSLGPLNQINERCTNALRLIDKLYVSMTNFVRDRDDSEKCVEQCNACVSQFPLIKAEVLKLLEDVRKEQKRYNRKTINIGFGGKKGTGKSYLLQKLSGLTSNEVPSKKGLPVTAVSSKIFNSSTSRAIVTFYDESSFLKDIIAPYCIALGINVPQSLAEFATMELPEPSDLNIGYIEKLRSFQQHRAEYENYLTGDTREIPLEDIRKFVAYTDEHDQDIFTYLAVKDATIHTPFPQTSVQQLGFIDLPGLGELNPTVERRHTQGFNDDVDLVLLIRRPSSERVDWDQADHNALEVLKASSPPDNFSNFVVVVHNEGGCEDSMCEKSMQSMKASLPESLQILRTQGQDTEELSRDILTQILSHLALKLPDMDRQTLERITQTSANLFNKLASFAKGAHGALKASNDGGHRDEVYIDMAEKCRDEFSYGCQEALYDLQMDVDHRKESPELQERLEEIQNNIDAYFENGLELRTSKEDWMKRAKSNIARSGNSSGVFTETGQNIRVKIAEEFATLDDIYRLRVDNLLEKIVEQFDITIPGLLPNKTPREKLTYLRERIEAADYNMQTIHTAIDTILNLNIEHRTHFYPRVYEPIRDFLDFLRKNATVQNATDLDRDQQAEATFHTLKDLSDRTIMLINDKLREETKMINDILYVSMEHFIDKMTRSEETKKEWLRLIRTCFNEIHGTGGNASTSIAINDIMKQLKDLQTSCL